MPPDLSSFAWSMLPAVAGGLTGGPGGAALGLAHGLGGQQKLAFDIDKQNADIQFGNIQAGQAQERIGLAREQQELAREQHAEQAKHWGFLNQGIVDGMKTADLNRQKDRFELDIAMRDDKNLEAYRVKNNLNEADYRLLRTNPVAFEENRFKDNAAIETMAGVLKTYNLAPGLNPRDVAVAWGPKVTNQFILNEQKHQQEMKQIQGHQATAGMNRWEVVPTPDGIYAFNRTNRQMELIKPGFTSKPEQRIKADAEMRQRFKSEKEGNPRMVGMEYEDYVSDPINQANLAFMGGEINPEQYESAMQNGRAQKAADEASARNKMFAAWAKRNNLTPDPNNAETAARWDKLWQDEKTGPETQGTYNQWLKVERKDKGWKTTPPQAREPTETRREGGRAWTGGGGPDMNAIPNPPPGQMVIRDQKTGKTFNYPVGEVPENFSRIK